MPGGAGAATGAGASTRGDALTPRPLFSRALAAPLLPPAAGGTTAGTCGGLAAFPPNGLATSEVLGPRELRGVVDLDPRGVRVPLVGATVAFAAFIRPSHAYRVSWNRVMAGTGGLECVCANALLYFGVVFVRWAPISGFFSF